ncbi:hypothetical protein [Alkalihalobacillus sp. CinArs1]|uniref:hypothetical protein n=1 Tax=Alkalihalobacillus sp. CinArs1 TaxID=2995314 RepID=UPI0022DDE25D|nr:hypothetical protein [Alkalihalobacillus sp. CinArs1]
MKRLHKVNVTLFSLLLISLVLMVLIVYRDINSNLGIGIVIAGLVFVFLYVFYLAILAIVKLFGMDRDEKKGRLLKFLAWFGGLTVMDVAVSLITSTDIRPLDFFTSFGIAVGITFFDVLFFKQQRYDKGVTPK